MAEGAAYDVLVALHVTAAVLGFGSVALSGVYGANAYRLAGKTGRAQEAASEELHRYFRAPGRLEWAVLAVPVFGAGAVVAGQGGRGFAEVWVGLGLGLWLVAAALLLGVVRPAEAALRASLAAEAPGAADPRFRSAGRRLSWAAAASDLIFLVALVVMVIKPGS